MSDPIEKAQIAASAEKMEAIDTKPEREQQPAEALAAARGAIGNEANRATSAVDTDVHATEVISPSAGEAARVLGAKEREEIVAAKETVDTRLDAVSGEKGGENKEQREQAIEEIRAGIVLLVDDNETVTEKLKGALSDLGKTEGVFSAKSVQGAKKALRNILDQLPADKASTIRTILDMDILQYDDDDVPATGAGMGVLQAMQSTIGEWNSVRAQEGKPPVALDIIFNSSHLANPEERTTGLEALTSKYPGVNVEGAGYSADKVGAVEALLEHVASNVPAQENSRGEAKVEAGNESLRGVIEEARAMLVRSAKLLDLEKMAEELAATGPSMDDFQTALAARTRQPLDRVGMQAAMEAEDSIRERGGEGWDREDRGIEKDYRERAIDALGILGAAAKKMEMALSELPSRTAAQETLLKLTEATESSISSWSSRRGDVWDARDIIGTQGRRLTAAMHEL